jgi:XRE family aerobic/anaerobic benzoate catabolism transcriptional regulator
MKAPPPNAAMRIALVGCAARANRRSGKMLAEKLGYPFVELNRVVEQEYGASVLDADRDVGRQHFRRYERKCPGTRIWPTTTRS